jgi:hypothetical protein
MQIKFSLNFKRRPYKPSLNFPNYTDLARQGKIYFLPAILINFLNGLLNGLQVLESKGLLNGRQGQRFAA